LKHGKERKERRGAVAMEDTTVALTAKMIENFTVMKFL
jgi:hypothetical protein